MIHGILSVGGLYALIGISTVVEIAGRIISLFN